MDSIITTLEGSEIKQVFYAADACYSGLGIRTSGAEDPRLTGPWRELAKMNRFVTLSAGTDGEKAMDNYTGPDNNESPQGLFTYYLLDAMNGAADFDQDGWINDVEIYAHINNHVNKEAARFRHPQSPNFAQRGKGRILFANPKAEEVKENRKLADQVEELKLDLNNKDVQLTIKTLLAESRLKAINDDSNAAIALARAGLSLETMHHAGSEHFALLTKHQLRWHGFKKLDSTFIGKTFHPGRVSEYNRFFSSVDVKTLAFSPDGQQLATATDGQQAAILWNTSTGAGIRALIGHEKDINHLSYSPNGQQLATASDDKTVKIWNTETGALLHTLTGHAVEVMHLVFSPDGKRLATIAYDFRSKMDKTVKIWDTHSGELIQTLNGHHHFVRHLAYSPDGKYLATASKDKTAIIWNTQTGKPNHVLKGHQAGLIKLAFSPDGKRLATGASDKTAKIWDVQHGKLIHTLDGHVRHVEGLTFSPDGQQLATVDKGKIKLWRVSSGKQLHELVGHDTHTSHLAYSPDGRLLTTAGYDEKIKLWNPRTGERIHLLEEPRDEPSLVLKSWVNHFAFSTNGQNLAIASNVSRIYSFPPIDPIDLLNETQSLTNARVCPKSLMVVDVQPPLPKYTVWAPHHLCE